MDLSRAVYNRDLKIVSLNVDSSKDKVRAAKTKRLPAFNFYAFASQLLSPISFDVPAGQFGTYPGIGPIPATGSRSPEATRRCRSASTAFDLEPIRISAVAGTMVQPPRETRP